MKIKNPGNPLCIALAGAGGSQQSTITAVAHALHEIPGIRVIIFDVSRFDQRGRADYSASLGHVVQFDYSNLDIVPMFRTAAPNFLIYGARKLNIKLKNLYDNYIIKYDIDAIMVCHYYGYPEQSLIESAKSNGIPIAIIDEGPFSQSVQDANGSKDRSLRARLLRLAVRTGLLPPRDFSGRSFDLFFATSQGRKNYLLERGIPGDRIVLSPSPRYDMLLAAWKDWRERKLTSIGVSRILIIHQPFYRDKKVNKAATDAAEKVLMLGLAQARKSRNFDLFVRFHPRADETERARYLKTLEKWGASAGSDNDRSFVDSIKKYDVFVGHYSSALLEAAGSGAPILVSEIAESGFSNLVEASKMMAMARYGCSAYDKSELFAQGVIDALDAPPCSPNPVLMEEELGPSGVLGSRIVAERLYALAKSRAERAAPYADV